MKNKKLASLSIVVSALCLSSCEFSFLSSSKSSSPALASSESTGQLTSSSSSESLSSNPSSMSNESSSSSLSESVSIPSFDNYHLSWHDEFSGSEVDENKWGFQIGAGGWGNNEAQNYVKRGASVMDGKLKITAKRDSMVSNASFSSARLYSCNRFSFTYGRVEARISLPTLRGMWPAFWLLPQDNVYGIWPNSGEIDIMERLLSADEVESTNNDATISSSALHYGETDHYYYNVNHASSSVRDFHTYGVYWDQDSIKFYVDDLIHLSVNKSQWTCVNAKSENSPFDQNFYILLNVAVGGHAAYPTTDFVSDEMLVDYVRVYQKD